MHVFRISGLSMDIGMCVLMILGPSKVAAYSIGSFMKSGISEWRSGRSRMTAMEAEKRQSASRKGLRIMRPCSRLKKKDII